MARTSGGKFIDVDEQSFMRIARIEGQHSLVNILLDTFAFVARRQSAARCTREQASLYTLGLRVVGHVLDDDTPFTFNVNGPNWPSVCDFRRADVALTADPVALLERRAVVVGVVESALLDGGQSVDSVVSRLVGNVGVFLQNQRVVFDGVL